MKKIMLLLVKPALAALIASILCCGTAHASWPFAGKNEEQPQSKNDGPPDSVITHFFTNPEGIYGPGKRELVSVTRGRPYPAGERHIHAGLGEPLYPIRVQIRYLDGPNNGKVNDREILCYKDPFDDWYTLSWSMTQGDRNMYREHMMTWVNPAPRPEAEQERLAGPQTTQPKIDPPRPQPRPRIANPNVRPAVLADNKVGTPNVGIAGIDAKWSNYGQYLQKLIDTVQIQFEDINERARFLPPTGTKVTVKFRIDSEGRIAEVIDADGNGGSQATRICTSSITDRAPYGKWTDDMIAMLGESQEMTFNFYYGRP